MLDKDSSSDFAITSALRDAVNAALNDPEFIHNLAEKLADIMENRLSQQRNVKLAEIKNMLSEGINSGRAGSAESVFNRLAEKYRTMIAEAGK
ncbi:MAG: hypothetical protein R3D71_01125 [Rickettsiales bacterium]